MEQYEFAQYWPPVLSLFREDYTTRQAYQDAYQERCKHYGYKVRVEGGWKFFEFETDYLTWKNQK